MLHQYDHKVFENRFRDAQMPPGKVPRAPGEYLAVTEGGITPAEFRRLTRSLQIAAVAGFIDEPVAIAATLVGKHSSVDRYAELDNKDAWMEAIAWAKAHPDFYVTPSWTERIRHVGEACARLIGKGFTIEVSAFGPHASKQVVDRICAQVASLVRHVGGLDCAIQITRILKDTNSFHDGFFVLGNRVSSVSGTHGPAYPWGWLMSLALAKVGLPANPRKPAIAWKTLTETARDFAAIRDCQRYSQYEQNIHVAPEEFEQVVADAIAWRELFSFPQAPELVVGKIDGALRTCLTKDDEGKLGFKISGLLGELRQLLKRSHDNEIRLFASGPVKAAHPILWALALGRKGKVNSGYRLPTDSHHRNQDRFLIFESPEGNVALLPRALAANAACETIFRLIWERLPRARASKVIGQVLEMAIEHACSEKKPFRVERDISYIRSKQSFQLDVGTREDDTVVLFETKAKSLTAKARSGVIYSAFKDYSDSFLAMLNQLVRHDHYLRTTGLPPLTATGDSATTLNVFKVAVSPLSYGPIMDRLLTAAAMPAIIGHSFGSVSTKADDEKAIEDFNVATRELLNRLVNVAPLNNENELDLFPYFIDVYWLDLGQLLYALDRAPTVSAAFRPLKHLTFGSRDFWTEIAFSDMQGLTARHGWRQPSKR